MEKMKFEVDSTSVMEGDIVEVVWDCSSASKVQLQIDNGFRSSTMELPTTGSKRFRLNRSKGKTLLTITATVNEKDYKKTIKVKVKQMPTTRAETVDSEGRKMGALSEPIRKAKEWARGLKMRWKDYFNALPADKQLAARIVVVAVPWILLSLLLPVLWMVGIFFLLAYLVYYIRRR